MGQPDHVIRFLPCRHLFHCKLVSMGPSIHHVDKFSTTFWPPRQHGHILWQYKYFSIFFADLRERVFTWILNPPPPPLQLSTWFMDGHHAKLKKRHYLAEKHLIIVSERFLIKKVFGIFLSFNPNVVNGSFTLNGRDK